MKSSIKQGRVEIWLRGKKLKGGFALIRIRNERWLLLKMSDEEASESKNPLSTQRKSALTGRTMSQITKEASK